MGNAAQHRKVNNGSFAKRAKYRLSAMPGVANVRYGLDLGWYLKARRKGTYSQFGEDVFIADYFKGSAPGRYMDIGANHPVKNSNTYLLYRLGWSGLTVDPVEHLVGMHRRVRRRDIAVCSAVGTSGGSVSFYELQPTGFSTLDRAHAEELVRLRQARMKVREVPIARADVLWGQHFAEQPPGFISIDTEGAEMEVLRSLDLVDQRPRLISIEIVRPLDDGASVEPLEFLQAHGYRVIRQFGVNLILEDDKSA
jgi:FkbM family methyltransferase